MPAADRLNHALSLRLSERQYRHLVAQAGFAGVPLSEAARRALDRDIESRPDIPIAGNAPGDSGLDYRSFLDVADFTDAIAELEGDAST